MAVSSASNSTSSKLVTADCPGTKKVIGTGAGLNGNVNGNVPTQTQDVVIGDVYPSSDDQVLVQAAETTATAKDWSVTAYALCANVG